VHTHAQGSGEEGDTGLLATPQAISRRLAQLDAAAGEDVALWVTAWSSVTPTPGPQTLGTVQGLWVADFLGAMAEAGVDLAAYWAIHNDLTPQGGDYGYLPRSYGGDPDTPRPAYHAFQMASQALRGALYPSSTGQEALTSYLTRSEEEVALLLVNKSPSVTFRPTLDVPGLSGSLRISVLREGDAGPVEAAELVLPPRSLLLVRPQRP
jgi:hypothetical protein